MYAPYQPQHHSLCMLMSCARAGEQVQEQKGLDIVRRDWCPLSKDVGNFALAQILSGRPAEDVVLAIHNQLMEVMAGSGGHICGVRAQGSKLYHQLQFIGLLLAVSTCSR